MFWPRLLLTLGSVAAVSAVSAQQITVQPGDTLWDIAKRYDASIDDLIIANGLTRTVLRPGETLRVPVTTYTVRRGDTLSGIAASFGMAEADLRALNQMSGSSIRAGQTLLIKDAFGTPALNSTSGAAASASNAATPNTAAPEVYTVRPGDTLSGVAVRYGIEINDLRRLNGLAGSSIRVGQRLTLRAPEGGTLARIDSYTVRPGDTLTDIAAVFGTTTTELRTLNDLRGSTIRSGQVLRLPTSPVLVAATDTTEAPAAEVPAVEAPAAEAPAAVPSEEASVDASADTSGVVAEVSETAVAEAAEAVVDDAVANDAVVDDTVVDDTVVNDTAVDEAAVADDTVTESLVDVSRDAEVATEDVIAEDVTADVAADDVAAEVADTATDVATDNATTDVATDNVTTENAATDDVATEAVAADNAVDVATEADEAVASAPQPTYVAATSVVVSGEETLADLAERYQTSAEAIVALNGFTGTDLLPDATVKIPFPDEIITQPGDTLEGLAERYQTSAEAIVAHNGFTGSDVLPNAVVKIPATPEFYTVRPGDTISEVAEAHGTTMAELRTLNGLTNNTIRAGEALRVRRPISAAILAGELESEPSAATPATPAVPPAEVVVKPGDTLWDLAQRYDTTIPALQAENNLTNSRLVPGTVVRLPSGSNARPERYRVQSGDTLYDIAVAFDMSIDDIVAINDLDGALIQVGQELALTTTTPPASLSVTVRPGDSLWLIAREHDVSVGALREANGLGASTLQPGDTLTIPGRYASVNAAADQGGSAAATITVGRGESLWLLARRHGTSVTALMAANNLRSTNVFVGQRLRVVPGNELSPAVAAAPAPAPRPAPVPNTQASMVWPLNGAVTSRFGYRRLRIAGSNYHTGLDLDGEIGDPIYSATSGRVVFSGWRGGYGNLVIVRSGNREYYYAHGAERRVSAGDTVRVGQVVATVGITGTTTGSHLHFEIRENGRPLDPLPILQQQASRL